MEKIKIGILGYGNLGKGVEIACRQHPDMQLVGVFTRRNPKELETITGVPVYSVRDVEAMQGKIDVMILCGGSATDLPEQGPRYVKWFHTIDSFDTHAKVPEYLKNMDSVAKESGHLAIACVGWDPGLFSLQRLLLESVLPEGNSYVFYGRGLSQGHSDAVRRIEGVKNAVQYTVPYEEAVEKVRRGENPQFVSVGETMWRECFVVLEEGADAKKVEQAIKAMPNYFEPYHTEVHFISEETLRKEHKTMPHGGFVLRSAKTGENTKQIAEFSLKLESNPEFTASVLVAYARAAYRMAKKGETGVRTVLDVPPALLSLRTTEEIYKEII